ncbi:MAG: hypothetical protein IID45_08105 [Planctomycetes bacterium]|nr:hypothetical protein [Planctomycetota bacterium]
MVDTTAAMSSSVTLGSLAAGLFVSTVRWAIIDTIHHHTGIAPPDWRFESLAVKYAAFELVIDHHYRHFQFHANVFVALAFTFFAYWISSAKINGWMVLVFLAVEALLWFGSRDTLRKYYRRGEILLHSERVPVTTQPKKPRKILNIEGPLH